MASIDESALLKALNELDATLSKGDSLASQDTEGTFSTEGSSLSSTYKGRGAGDISKMMSASDVESGEEGSEGESGEDDSESEGEAPAPEMGKGNTKKSLAQEINESEGMRRTMDASPFLNNLTKSLVSRQDNVEAGIQKLKRSLRKSTTNDSRFKAKVAVALTHLSKSMQVLHREINAIGSRAGVRKSTLSASEIAYTSPYEGAAEDTLVKSVPNVHAMIDAVSDMVREGQMSAALGMRLESERYDINILPEQLRKSLITRLNKSIV